MPLWGGGGGGAVVADAVAYLSDTRAAGTDAGGTTIGAWNVCPLNTENSDAGGIVSLVSNQMTLQAGTYEIDLDGILYSSTFSKLRLRNITDGATVLVGLAQEANASNNRSSTFRLMGLFTISAQKTFELQYQVSVAEATDGLGRAAGFAEAEVYRTVKIVKKGA